MKLIFEYSWCIPWEADGTETFAIEFESLLGFQCYVLDKIKEAKQKGDTLLTLFDFTFYHLDELEEQIQTNVFTLENWFEKRMVKF